MPKRFQFAVLKLSEQAQTLIRRMIDAGQGPYVTAAAVKKQTGETVTPTSLYRYAKHYQMLQRLEKNGRLQTDRLVQQAADQGEQISELLRAAFHESFSEKSMNGAIRDMNPLALEAAERKRQELKLKEKQFLLAERRVDVFEKRLLFDRERRAAELKRLEDKAHAGQPLTPDDIRRIREIYGLDQCEIEVEPEETQLEHRERAHSDPALCDHREPTVPVASGLKCS
jgi:hypothetical protein